LTDAKNAHKDRSFYFKDKQMKKFLVALALWSIYLPSLWARGQETDSLEVLYDRVPAKTFLGARTTLVSDQLTTTPSTGYLPALTGRVPGFYTQQNRGFRLTNTAVNYNVDIFVGNRPIAGAGVPSENTEYDLSLRRQAPIVVIDGIQRDIFSIDPENIESITVLKDALSTIALGQRSSRGVLLITTKKPQVGTTRISFTAQAALQEPLSLPKPLPSYQFAYLLNEALTNGGNQPAYTEEQFELFRAGTDPLRYPNTDWYDQVLRKTAPLMRYNLSANGGGKTAQYAIALNYTDQRGLFKESPDVAYNTNSSLRRYSLNTNVNIRITDRFTLGMQLMGRIQDGNEPGVGTQNLLETLKKTPNGVYPIRNANGSWGSNSYFKDNLLALTTNSGYRQDHLKDVMANIDLRYDLNDWVKGLSVKATTNIAVQSLTGIVRERKEPTYQMVVGPAGDTAYNVMATAAAQSNNFNTVFNARYWFGQVSVNYKRDWEEHHVEASLMGDQRRTLFNYDLPAVATNLTGKLSYDYQGKYMAQAALNTSGFNRYRPGYQYGLFYAFGLGWNIKKEPFLQDGATWLDELKVRGTFGKTGNGVDNSGYYDYRATFMATDGRIGSGVYSAGTERSELRGYWENTYLPNVRTWEGAYKLNVGFDAAFFGNRLQWVADAYYDRYFDLLQTRGKSIEMIGIAYPAENIGKTAIKGLESTWTYQQQLGNFGYFASANLTVEQTKIVFFDEQQQRYSWQQLTGLPIGSRMGYVAEGLFQTMEEAESSASTIGYEAQPGDIKYRDLNEDGVINQFDRTLISSTKPLIYYGLTLGFHWKGLECSALIQGVSNREIYLGDRAIHGGFLGFGGFEQAYEPVLDRWTPETGATATYPRLTIGNSHNYAESSFWIRSGNYFRLKNVQVAYHFPASFAEKLRLNGLEIFANALNVSTWAAYKGQDPEVPIGSYPLQRVFNVGVHVNL